MGENSRKWLRQVGRCDLRTGNSVVDRGHPFYQELSPDRYVGQASRSRVAPAT